ISEQVEQLTADPQWQVMLDAAAKFHTYSLNNQLLITLQAAQLAINPTRVAGFTTWKTLGRNVVKGSTGLAVLAPCTYTAKDSGSDPTAPTAAPATGIAGQPAGGDAERPAGGRVLRGFRVAYLFDVSQTKGDPLPDVVPELLCGDAPAALWQAIATQLAAHGYTLTREHCGPANGLTDPTARVQVRPDVADAQAVETLAHELAHIECGHTTDGYDYRVCRGQAEAEAESVAYIITAWAGLDSAAYTVPYVAGWSAGDIDVARAAATTVTAAARRILDHLDGAADGTENAVGTGTPPSPPDRSSRPRAPAPQIDRQSVDMTAAPPQTAPPPRRPSKEIRHEYGDRRAWARGPDQARLRHDGHDTTTSAPKASPATTPEEAPATEVTPGAGSEQRETEHVDSAGTGSRSAEATENSGRAHQLVWLDPPGTGRPPPQHPQRPWRPVRGWPTPSPPKARWNPSPGSRTSPRTGHRVTSWSGRAPPPAAAVLAGAGSIWGSAAEASAGDANPPSSRGDAMIRGSGPRHQAHRKFPVVRPCRSVAGRASQAAQLRAP
ncbi:MAG: ArdC-like ssDNA-binding domain-containing protein, partial [Actinomycetota bacterium]|nr:ArdC-like ssDNA-binding domain-containing protein [Actinomycetota bacterium]